MKAAIYTAALSDEDFETELATARAFCAARGLTPVKIYRAETAHERPLIEAFVRQARAGAFQVVVAPVPECFSTQLLTRLVSAGVGLACHAVR